MSRSPSGRPSPIPAGQPSSPADPDEVVPLPMTPGRAGRELVYALAGMPVAVVGLLHLLVMLLSASWSTALVGLPMLAAGVRGSRSLGALNLGLARRLLGVRTPAPAPFRPRPGLVGWCASALGDDVGWRATAYLVVKPLTALLALGTAAGFWGGGLFLLTFPDQWWTLGPVSVEFPQVLLRIAAGLALLALAPWALRAALLPERLLTRTLLGPTRTSARIDHLEATRARMAEDSTVTLRRIERDLHDGPQARLVALAMVLGMAKEEFEASPRDGGFQQARDLVDIAHRDVKEVLAELRLLIHGIYPPVLDQGLEAALGMLVTRFTLPVDLRVDLPRRPSAALEATVYFCVAELLANVVRHSGARRAIVEVREHGGLLRLHVGDDGTGGASMGAGTGLPGLAARVGVVDGHLEIDSPAGGPTVVTVEVPLHT